MGHEIMKQQRKAVPTFVHKFVHQSNRLPVIFASYFTQNKLIHQHDTIGQV